MCDIVWISPQSHSSLSVKPHFLWQALQWPWPVRKRFSSEHWRLWRSKPGSRIVGSTTKVELTTVADCQSSLYQLVTSIVCKSLHSLRDSRRSGEGWKTSSHNGQSRWHSACVINFSVAALRRRAGGSIFVRMAQPLWWRRRQLFNSLYCVLLYVFVILWTRYRYHVCLQLHYDDDMIRWWRWWIYLLCTVADTGRRTRRGNYECALMDFSIMSFLFFRHWTSLVRQYLDLTSPSMKYVDISHASCAGRSAPFVHCVLILCMSVLPRGTLFYKPMYFAVISLMHFWYTWLYSVYLQPLYIVMDSSTANVI